MKTRYWWLAASIFLGAVILVMTQIAKQLGIAAGGVPTTTVDILARTILVLLPVWAGLVYATAKSWVQIR